MMFSTKRGCALRRQVYIDTSGYRDTFHEYPFRSVPARPEGTLVLKENNMARVLIVDDDPDVVEACTLVLEKAGHEVSSATNRDEGMKAVTGFQPELLVLDVMMDQPDDGIAMAQDLRRDGFTAPILMLTSISKVAGQKYGKDNDLLPVDDFQEKPIDPSVLVAKVSELLQGKES